MSRSGGQFKARPPVFMSLSKLDTPLSTHCSKDERLSQPCPARKRAGGIFWNHTRNEERERVNINVALFSYTRAFGDGPRHFEPWSSDEDDT
ncbi:hypothetical protein TNCV_2539801 [Trichonephila clavipes]|nr:hypothetical protein TNCV_2539801 [Trichonephila clavipes]